LKYSYKAEKACIHLCSIESPLFIRFVSNRTWLMLYRPGWCCSNILDAYSEDDLRRGAGYPVWVFRDFLQRLLLNAEQYFDFAMAIFSFPPNSSPFFSSALYGQATDNILK
jgi:hypothetical protein